MSRLGALIRDAADRLGGLDIQAVEQAAVAAAAIRLRDDIRDSLSHAPGSDHTTPWRQTGTLHDSIARSIDGLTAVIGSTDPVAIDQELGTRTIPPRPFLAPAAARLGPSLARDIADATARALRHAATGDLR